MYLNLLTLQSISTLPMFPLSLYLLETEHRILERPHTLYTSRRRLTYSAVAITVLENKIISPSMFPAYHSQSSIPGISINLYYNLLIIPSSPRNGNVSTTGGTKAKATCQKRNKTRRRPTASRRNRAFPVATQLPSTETETTWIVGPCKGTWAASRDRE